jgi:glutathione S-transferase
VTRLDTYAIPVDRASRDYMDAILSLPAFREWLEAALDEPWVLEFDEVSEAPVEVLRRK